MKSFPKPRRLLLDRLAVKRAQDNEARQFRLAVWLRDGSHCRHCGRKVIHSLERVANAGHVHHRRGRNVAPEDKCNPDAAVLLCGRCHGDPSVVQLFRAREYAGARLLVDG